MTHSSRAARVKLRCLAAAWNALNSEIVGQSLRMGHGQLRGAYVTVKDNELYLLNAAIHSTSSVPISEPDQTRTRKLLAKRREIEASVAALLAEDWDMPRVVAGVGLWAGDRDLRNADVLHQIAKRLVRTQLASPARLVLHSPIDILRQSFALGVEVRKQRESDAGTTRE